MQEDNSLGQIRTSCESEEKIVVIEDDDDLLQNVIDCLQEEGYYTRGASTGLEGVRLIKEIKPDLVICDVRIPNMNGYDVLRDIRENPLLSTLPFIFLSAKAAYDDFRYGMSMGADDYIVKPFRIPDLLDSVRVRLDRIRSVKDHMKHRDR